MDGKAAISLRFAHDDLGVVLVVAGLLVLNLTGLVLVERLDADNRLTGYHLLPATRADLLRRLGRLPEATAAYREAIELADTDPVREFLVRRLSALST